MLTTLPRCPVTPMYPDPGSLSLLVNAVDLGSISRAAEISHIALAAASRRIALLEHHYKVKLLTRTSRGVEPTAAGRAALPQIRQMLALMQKIDVEMSDYATGTTGHIRIQAATSALAQFLPSDLAAFTKAHPNVRLDIEERWSSEILDAVRARAIDVGVVLEQDNVTDLQLLPYRRDDLVAIAPTDFAIKGKSVYFKQLIGHDFVGLESRTALTGRLQAEAMSAGQPLRLRVQVRSFDAVCRMVESGHGVAVLPENVVRPFVKERRLKAIALKDSWARRHMYICVTSVDDLSNAAKGLLAQMTQPAQT